MGFISNASFSLLTVILQEEGAMPQQTANQFWFASKKIPRKGRRRMD